MAIGELEYDYKDFERAKAGDEKLAIRFFRKPKQDMDKTNAEGRPIFVEVEYIQIIVPGDRSNIVIRPVSPGDIMRFQQQYEHWKKTEEETMQAGTPLEAWGILNLAQVEEFRYFGIRTIENMANLRDDLCQKIMGATELKQKAARFLELAQSEAPLRKVQEELDKRDSEIAMLKENLRKLSEKLDEVQKKAA